MTRHKQTIFGYGSGDCFRTCVACILDLAVEDVPNFCLKETWLEDLVRWCSERGVGVVYLDRPQHDLYLMNCYAIATGQSPRWRSMVEKHPDVLPSKFLHAVIAKIGGYGVKDEWVHDPHPDNTFVEDVRDWIILVPQQAAIQARPA